MARLSSFWSNYFNKVCLFCNWQKKPIWRSCHFSSQGQSQFKGWLCPRQESNPSSTAQKADDLPAEPSLSYGYFIFSILKVSWEALKFMGSIWKKKSSLFRACFDYLRVFLNLLNLLLDLRKIPARRHYCYSEFGYKPGTIAPDKEGRFYKESGYSQNNYNKED